MNKLEDLWPKFKQELPSILYLCSTQILLNFNFPVFVRLGFPLSIIAATILSIMAIFVYIYVFLFADKFAPSFNLEYLDDAPTHVRDILKKIERVGLIVIAHLAMLFSWYYNIYGISNIYYAIYYVHFVTAFVLIARAIKRSQI
jgi:hypothetical protein